MLLTISTTHQPATDLGFLLHKNPARAHMVNLSFGTGWVFYPEATDRRCTAALLLDIDPIGLIRSDRGGTDQRFTLGSYVNDRAYAASSFMSVAIGRAFGTAMSGRSKERPLLAEGEIPLEFELAAISSRGGEATIRRLFEPLGYTVAVKAEPNDPQFPEWGESRYFHVSLGTNKRVVDALMHLTVLLPVLDDDKHYFVGADEVEKLLRRGTGWLADHPDRELISRRYLKHRANLVRLALERLNEDEANESDGQPSVAEEELEATVRLHDLRLDAAAEAVVACGARTVLDLGCGDGQLIDRIAKLSSVRRILGVDVAVSSLGRARRRLRLDGANPRRSERITITHGSVIYRDSRFDGFEAATITEVVEHLDPYRLSAFSRVVFEFARPQTVIMTTPNREYNALFPALLPGQLRHGDHRFEWTRAEFAAWCAEITGAFGYTATIQGIGPEDPTLGAPSQMAVFTREEAA